MNTVAQMFGKLETNPSNTPTRVARGDRFGIGLHHKQGHGTVTGLAKWKVSKGGPGHTYHFDIDQVRPDDRWMVHQCWPLDVELPHAGDHNVGRYAIVVTGDFDEGPMPEEAMWLMCELSALISIWHDWRRPHEIVFSTGWRGREIDGPRVAGHRELRWSTGKVNRSTGWPLPIKTCPGSEVDTKELRDLVSRHILSRSHYSPDDAARELLDAGVLLETPGVP